MQTNNTHQATEGDKLKYAEIIKDIGSEVFSRKDLLKAVKERNPSYNAGSFNRQFSKLLSSGQIGRTGEDMYIAVTPETSRQIYTHASPSKELLGVEAFLSTEFYLADFIAWETIQLNEFLNHLLAQNAVIVMVERMLMDAFYERLKGEFTSVLFSPKPEDYQRYRSNGAIIVEKLSSRYPKNPKQRHGYSIEKLIVDLFAEKIIKETVSYGDYPAALELIFQRYRVNETKLFNYARSRYVDAEIRMMIKSETSIRLYTDERGRRNAQQEQLYFGEN
jgi:hypothetical protein